MLDCELSTHYVVRFQRKNLEKVMNPLILPTVDGVILPLLFFNKDGWMSQLWGVAEYTEFISAEG